MYNPSFIKDVFTNVAGKYDIMNDLMSLGLHRVWKKKLCSLIDVLDAPIIDTATGSGDIAFLLMQMAAKKGLTPRITAVDKNPSMLSLAKVRKIIKNIKNELDIVEADATNLPFEDKSFSYYTISFVIRNIPYILKALQEAHRVLKPGGKFLCLEFSKPQIPYISSAYNFYSDKFIPQMGKIVAGNKDAYQYLVNSIRSFPSQEVFLQMMQKAGFRMSYVHDLSFSIASI